MLCAHLSHLALILLSDKIRARCDKCAQSMNTLTGSKRDSNTQPELMSPKPDKISRSIIEEEDQEDPMENMDLDGKGSTSYAEIVSRSIVPEITVTEEQLIKPKKYFINICEKCNRQGKGMNSVNLLRYHKYWNHENKRIEIQELNICEKCIEKDEKEILKENMEYKVEYCHRCGEEGTRSDMQNRFEGYDTVYYCDLNCQYAQMIIYEIGELQDQDKIDTLIKRYTTSTKYAGSSYGSVTEDSIREKLNFPTRKGKEPEPLLREKDIKQEEDIRERLNGPVDEIIIQNQKEDNDKIRNEILTQLGIKPITLKDDDYENEKNQIIVQKIEQVIEERIIKKENAPEGLEYYRTAYDFQQKQLESLKQERDCFIKRQQELSNTIARQNMAIESLEEQLKQQHTLYNEEWLRVEQLMNEVNYLVKKGNKYLTRYTDKIQEQQDQIDQQQEHNNRLLEDNERGFQLNQQILKNNKELEKELTDVKNGLDKREKDLQKELEKRDQELKEYAELTEQWEQMMNGNQKMEIEPLYYEPLTPQSQEIFNNLVFDDMIEEIDNICTGKSPEKLTL